jgi:tetratricopeptide (TPR) repeat protein
LRFLPILLLAIPAAGQTFNRDIAPIIYSNCAACHRHGSSGPFTLLSYDDVRSHLRAIVAATASRVMPPWLPEAGYGDFADERRLSAAQIGLIAAWAKAGAPEGPASERTAPPEFSDDWQLGPPDLVLTAAQPFKVPASGSDVFWNFVFSPDISSTRYVRAVEIRPGGHHMAHHANLLIDRFHVSRAKEKTPGSGFPGMDLNIQGSVFDPPGQLLFWKPGSGADIEPDGYAWRLEPGNDLVLNIHMHPMGMSDEIQPSIGLYFTDKPPTHFPMLIQLDHDGALDIPPGAADFVVSDNLRLPVDADVLAVYPHAHYLGKLLEAWATLPSGKREWLIRIPQWDPGVQGVYRFRQPVFLPKGTVISMRYHYDNSTANPRNPNKPPRRVRGGDSATDEMAHLWLQVLPRGPGDHRREIEEAVVRRRIEKNPDDYAAHLQLGEIAVSRLDFPGAITVLEQAVRIAPDQSQGHNILGAAFIRVGRAGEAIQQFQTALQLDPANVNARYNLVFALVRAGRAREAAGHMEQVVAAYPNDAGLHNLWGELLATDGKNAAAIAQFDEALRLDPAFEAARQNRDEIRSHAVPGSN